VRTSDGGALVVKVYSDVLHWKMEKEVFVYGLLSGHALAAPVPAVLAADDSKTLLPQNVLDCHYGNVLVVPGVDGRRMSGMLDFENVLAGDPLLDLAKAHCYSPRRNETLLAALVEGYGDLRSDWREALDLYVLYHWLELWDWLASLDRTEALDELTRCGCSQDKSNGLRASSPPCRALPCTAAAAGIGRSF
jgi:Phosphotransferase enzyme family